MIVLVGCSGSGKTTIANCLVKDYGYKSTVSYTTRPMRVGERDGVDYHFISDEEFLKKKESGFFAESAKYREWYYGTAKDDCTDDKIAVLTPHGLRQMKKIPTLNIMSFYIDVPRADRMIKVLSRGDDIEEIKRRDSSDVGQFDGIEDEVDQVINNEGYKNSPEFLAKSIHFTYTARKRTDKRLTILCDVDGVVDNLVEEILEQYNTKYCDNLRYEDITEYCMDVFTKDECEDVFGEFCDCALVRNMKTTENAVEVVTELMKNHNFYFVTATKSWQVDEKYKWLRRNFQLFDEEHFIVCSDKQLIKGDVLIEDCPTNISPSVKLNLIYDQPWNRKVEENDNIIRVKNWNEIMKIISMYSNKELQYDS